MKEQLPSGLTHHQWWDTMYAMRVSMGEKAFVSWVKRAVHPWKARLFVIDELAWNDLNSDWSLEYDTITKKGKFPEGEPVTAYDVASSLNNMLEGFIE